MTKTYWLVPLTFMVLGAYSLQKHSTGGYVVGGIFTILAAIEWNAYWIYRRNQR